MSSTPKTRLYWKHRWGDHFSTEKIGNVVYEVHHCIRCCGSTRRRPIENSGNSSWTYECPDGEFCHGISARKSRSGQGRLE
jgi:hypothetical protein